MAKRRAPKTYLDHLEYRLDPDCPPDQRMGLQLLSLVEDVRESVQGLSGILDEDKGKALDWLMESQECPGCGSRAYPGALYCSGYPCANIGHTVRYVRKALSDGSKRLELPAVQANLGTRHRSALQGGYDWKGRRLTAAQRQAIFKRDNWVCQICHAAKATQVDHILGSSNEPGNLRAACADCNRRLPFKAIAAYGDYQPSEDEKRFQTAVWYDTAMRIATREPLQLLDVPQWRSHAGRISYARRKAVEEEEEAGWEDIDGYVFHTMQKDD